MENYSESELLEKGEKIDEIVIDKRETDKEKNEDIVWCTVTIQDSKISSEKEMVLSYHKYDKKGWILEGVEVEDSDAWEIIPLKGITEKDIPKTLDGKVIKVDGNEWDISEKEVDEISIDKQETELNKKESICDRLDVHLIGDITYGGRKKNKGNHIYFESAKGRKSQARGVLYDDTF